jgi:hypothetical protein
MKMVRRRQVDPSERQMRNCDMRKDFDPSEKGGLAAVERRRAKRRRCEREVGFVRKRGYRLCR